jgi:nicotinamidase-related amidase
MAHTETIRLPVRQYIGVPSGHPRGLATETWELPVARTAFVELHCWNVGVPGGIPVPDDYWVFMGSKQNHERMARIVERVIVPCMDAARRVGMATVHVQPESVASRYPALRPEPRTGAGEQASRGAGERAAAARESSSRLRHSSLVNSRSSSEPVINHAVERAERVHGKGYMGWDGWTRLDVNPALKPQRGDVMIGTTEEFHGWLQARHITTLIYSGFCANLCIVDSPAAMKAMNGLGYRCVLLREATMAIEFSDQPADLHTQAAFRYIEAWVGYTGSAADWLKALKEGPVG